MSDKVLPIAFLNLAGEMIYVIKQRLEAQNISEDKSSKVIQDIISTMLNDQFIAELFKPQKMYSRSAMQFVFEKLVHSSIMRLNSNSMGKLYDLMLMVFKYQVVNCHCPEEILLVTLNHFDEIKICAKIYPDLMKKTEKLHSLLVSNYKDIPHEDYECLYNCIIAFLQDLNIRVSVLMKLGYQLPNGEIIQRNDVTTRDVKFVREVSVEDTEGISHGKKQMSYFPLHSLAFDGDRGTVLGKNIYDKSTAEHQRKASKSILSQSVSIMDNIQRNGSENFQAVEELSLLGRLIGKCTQANHIPEITLSCDEDIEDVHSAVVKDSCSFVSIDASQKCQKELGRISNELLVENDKKESDILELLDIAENIKIEQ
ncbi:protein OSCP1-like isoform X1 [Stegodyphus dumicola]|uniref:protein OSCP1-like isoform X1 n=1 Tax=Stegodyphus dumicola TaxID=202533 RepID=UPI0015AC4A47|nr:protein OSCP1-like isoform X1 [Stegodyphus dumicola]XP_035222997.1 protein OSCP1-like isoform X1 [Stegodyphus dumicola]